MFIKAILFASLLATTQHAGADTLYTGNELLAEYKSSERLMALRYLQGQLDAETKQHILENAFASLEKRPPNPRRYFCIPSGATVGQAMDVVILFLEQTPERRHESASNLISAVFVQKWRCQTMSQMATVADPV